MTQFEAIAAIHGLPVDPHSRVILMAVVLHGELNGCVASWLATSSAMVQATGIAERTIRRRLTELAAAGLVERVATIAGIEIVLRLETIGRSTDPGQVDRGRPTGPGVANGTGGGQVDRGRPTGPGSANETGQVDRGRPSRPANGTGVGQVDRPTGPGSANETGPLACGGVTSSPFGDYVPSGGESAGASPHETERTLSPSPEGTPVSQLVEAADRHPPVDWVAPPEPPSRAVQRAAHEAWRKIAGRTGGEVMTLSDRDARALEAVIDEHQPTVEEVLEAVSRIADWRAERGHRPVKVFWLADRIKDIRAERKAHSTGGPGRRRPVETVASADVYRQQAAQCDGTWASLLGPKGEAWSS